MKAKTREETDNEKLIRLLAEYRSGNENSLEKFYLLAVKIAKEMIRTEMRKKKFYVDEEEQQTKSIDAASYIIEQILARKDFELIRPTSYIYLRVKKELYYRRKVDELIFFCDMKELGKMI